MFGAVIICLIVVCSSADQNLTVVAVHMGPFSTGSWFLNSATNTPRWAQNKMFSDEASCQIRLFLIGLQEAQERLGDSGSGTIKGNDFSANCVYVTDKGFKVSKIKESPRTIGAAVLCAQSAKRHCPHLPDFNVVLTPEPTDSYHITSAPLTVAYSSNKLPPTALGTAGGMQVNSVCTAQVFRSPYSGLYLYLFASYYLSLGYMVIIYDRFGWHLEYLRDFMQHELFAYHPYTAMELAHPARYSAAYAANQSVEFKYYFGKFAQGGNGQGISTAERHEQDRDKRRTYDLARVQYAQLRSMLLLDSDELLLCRPNRAEHLNALSLQAFATVQQDTLSRLAAEDGVDELLFRRPTYFGRYPSSSVESPQSVELPTLNEHTMSCMSSGYTRKSLANMLSCWGEVHYTTAWKKSSDTAGKCPFHFAHWSCSPPSDKAEHRCLCRGCTVPREERCELMHLSNKCPRGDCRLKDLQVREDVNSYLLPLIQLLT